MPDRKYSIELVIAARQESGATNPDTLLQKIEAAKRELAKVSDGMAGGFQRSEAALGGIVASAAKLVVTAGSITSAVSAWNNAMKEADDRQRRFAENSNKGKAGLVELAGVIGQRSTDQFQREHAEFGVRTGLGDRATPFRLAFHGRAAQNIGPGAGPSRTMSVEHGLEYEARAAEIATQTGIEPGLVGDLAGAIASRTNWDQQHGAKAPAQAALELRRSLHVLQIGAGRNATLVSQMTRSMAELVRRDKERGLVRDPVELAGMISAMSERNPAAASRYLDRAVEDGLYQFNDPKAGPILKAAGVTYETPPKEAAGRLDAYISKRLKPGQTTEQFLRGHGFERLEAVGLGGLIDAERSGLLRQRAGAAAGITEQSMEAERAGMTRDPVVQIQRAGAAEQLAEVLRGQETGRVETARQAMRAQMLRDRQIGTRQSAARIGLFNSRVNPMTWLGFQASEDAMVDARLSGLLSPQSGVEPLSWQASFNPTGRTLKIQKQIEAIEGSGGNIADLIPLFRSMDQSLKGIQAQGQGHAGAVPLVPQQGGMVRP